ncbi:MAG: SRPBCC family protein [Methylobacterium sp.]|jgi:hypothetical protein|nr:SRPBCC family protein [Methylobacterium sp.]MCA3623314.1 SRPBCC family protein [Methylobacterium sp.]
MPTRDFESIVDTSPERMFAALADIGSWPDWDLALERIDHDGAAVRVGTAFRLKPKSGPAVPMRVEAFDGPHHFAVSARLPLARMRTAYRLLATGDGGTRVCVRVATRGLLAPLWDRLIAAPLEAGAAAHAQELAAFAGRS